MLDDCLVDESVAQCIVGHRVGRVSGSDPLDIVAAWHTCVAYGKNANNFALI